MATDFFGGLVDEEGSIIPGEGQRQISAKPKQKAQRAPGDFFSDLESEIGKPYKPPEKPGAVEDVARGTLAGLERGTAGLAGLPGDVLAAGRWVKEQGGYYGRKAGENLGLADEGAANRYWKEVQKEREDPNRDWIMGAIPTSAAMAKLAEEYVPGAGYQAHTKLGRIAQTAGEFAPAAVTALIPGVGGARAATIAQKVLPEAAKLAGAGALSEVAGQATSGTPLEPVARIGTAIAAPIVGRKYIAPAAGGVARAVADKTGLTTKIGRTAMEQENAAATAAGQAAKYSAEELADAGLHNKVGGNLVDNKIRSVGMTPQSDIARKDLVKEAVRQMQAGTPNRLSEGMVDDIIKARDSGNLTDDQIVAMVDAFGGAPSGLFNKFFNEATQARPDIRLRMEKILTDYNDRAGKIPNLAANMFGDMTNQSLTDAVSTYVKTRKLPPDLQKELIQGIQDQSLSIDDVIARANPKAYNKIWRPAYDKAGLGTSDELENILKNDSVQNVAAKVYEKMKRDWTDSGRRYEDFPNFLEFDTTSKKYYATNKTPIEFWDKLGQKISDIEGADGAATRDGINELIEQIFQDRGIANPFKQAKEQWKAYQSEKNSYSYGKSFVQRIADFKRDPDARKRALNMWGGLKHEEKLLFQAGVLNQLEETLKQGRQGFNFWNSKVMTNPDNRQLLEAVTNYNAPKGISNFDQIDNAFDMIKMMKDQDSVNLLRNTEAMGPYLSAARRMILNPSLVSGGLSGAALELLGKYALFGPTFGGASAVGAVGGLAAQISKNAKARAMLDLLEERNPEKIKEFLQEVKKEAAAGKPGYWRQVKSLLDYSNKDTQKKYIEAGKAVMRSGLAGIGQQNYETRMGARAAGGRVGYRNGGGPNMVSDSDEIDPSERTLGESFAAVPQAAGEFFSAIPNAVSNYFKSIPDRYSRTREALSNATPEQVAEAYRTQAKQTFVDPVVQAFTAPGRAYQGLIPQDQMLPEAMNFTGVLGASSVPAGVVGGYDPSRMSMFFSADHPSVPAARRKLAEDMLAQGMHPSDVWQRTMIGRIAPGFPAISEFSDTGMVLKPFPETGMLQSTVGREISHPELYSRYPMTKDLLLNRNFLEGERGSYMSPWQGKPGVIEIGPERPTGVVLHELQHGVAEQSGLPRGANSEDASLARYFQEIQQRAPNIINAIEKEKYNFVQSQLQGRTSPADLEKWQPWFEHRWNQENPEASRILAQAYKDLNATGFPTYDGYFREAGENLARMTDKSQFMSMEQRRKTPPWEREGWIPYTSQIIRTPQGITYVPPIPSKFMKKEGGRVKKYDDGGIVKSPDNFISPDDPQRKMNFDKWRKDIRTVDEQGNPLVVYRGQRLEDQMPTKFDLRAGRSSPSFSSDPEVANVYAGKRDQWPFKPHVGKYHLGMKKPLDIRHLGEVVTLGDFIREIPHDLTQYKEHKDEKGATKAGFHSFVDAFKNLSKMREKNLAIFDLDDVHQAAGTEAKLRHSQDLADFMEFYGSPDRVGRSGHDLQKVIKGLDAAQVDAYLLADSPDVKRLLSKLGYDGIIHKDAFEGGSHVYQGDKANLEKGVDTYRPFKMTSVKSATGNRGTFNRKDADPQKEQGGRVKRATGGRIPEMDRAFFKAKRDLDSRTKNIMDLPDDAVVKALHIAKGFI